jgi:protein-tyrosine phosphatase
VPSRQQVADFLEVVGESPGLVFVHCGAGVGRTGAMAAAYLVATGQASGTEAMMRNLAVGPPSLEQLTFAASLRADDVDKPPSVVVAASRVLDAPRRLWARVGRS